MHDGCIGNWSSVWQLKNEEDDGEGVPSCDRGCRDRIEGEGGVRLGRGYEKVGNRFIHR